MREPTFEEALQELEKTVQELESGKLTLEDSLKKFERGMKIQAFCRRKLDRSTAQMNRILEED
jgi:exodeoxyribonuclease VII small subunit|tara:strand:- start:14 stop:202 length:189 start_codon:yes stop_codon:yes gene_type:complete